MALYSKFATLIFYLLFGVHVVSCYSDCVVMSPQGTDGAYGLQTQSVTVCVLCVKYEESRQLASGCPLMWGMSKREHRPVCDKKYEKERQAWNMAMRKGLDTSGSLTTGHGMDTVGPQ